MPEPTAETSVRDYRPADDAEALELERLCPQGDSFRLSFRRPCFHRRAATFGEHRILTAWNSERLIGVVAVAVKAVELFGAPARAAFLFDLRVHPAARRKGVGRRLVSEALSWGLARAEIAYTYAVADNRIVRHVAHLVGGREAGGYAYLVVPTSGRPLPHEPATVADREDLHETMKRLEGPFDLYARPEARRDDGYRGSWISGGGPALAGCSAWDNREILAEVVEALPPTLRALSWASRTRTWRRLGWPPLPRPGETVRSWYLFDFFSSGGSAARDLLCHVAAVARERAVDFLYLPHAPGDRRIEALRSELPRLFSPVVNYRLIARSRSGGTADVRRLYVDVRDL